MKVICVGLSKMGMKILVKVLRILGYIVYDYFEYWNFYVNEWCVIFCEGKDFDFIVMYRDVDVVIDFLVVDWF